MKINIIIWTIATILIALVLYIFPTNTVMNNKGCITGKGWLTYKFNEVCYPPQEKGK